MSDELELNIETSDFKPEPEPQWPPPKEEWPEEPPLHKRVAAKPEYHKALKSFRNDE